MNENNIARSAHNWLKQAKAKHKISYKKLGSFINYSDVGLSKALENTTLSLDQIKIIAEKLDSIENLNDFISKTEENYLAEDPASYNSNKLKQLVLDINTFEDDLLKIPAFITFINKHTNKKLAKILSSKEELKKYLDI